MSQLLCRTPVPSARTVRQSSQTRRNWPLSTLWMRALRSPGLIHHRDGQPSEASARTAHSGAAPTRSAWLLPTLVTLTGCPAKHTTFSFFFSRPLLCSEPISSDIHNILFLSAGLG